MKIKLASVISGNSGCNSGSGEPSKEFSVKNWGRAAFCSSSKIFITRLRSYEDDMRIFMRMFPAGNPDSTLSRFER
jgi:hypothetical protein